MISGHLLDNIIIIIKNKNNNNNNFIIILAIIKSCLNVVWAAHNNYKAKIIMN